MKSHLQRAALSFLILLLVERLVLSAPHQVMAGNDDDDSAGDDDDSAGDDDDSAGDDDDSASDDDDSASDDDDSASDDDDTAGDDDDTTGDDDDSSSGTIDLLEVPYENREFGGGCACEVQGPADAGGAVLLLSLMALGSSRRRRKYGL